MTTNKRLRTNVIYRDRLTQEIVREVNQFEPTLQWLYENWLGITILRIFLNNPLFCFLYGVYQTLPHTRLKIDNFVAIHKIDTQEIELPLISYRSFNEFFSRRLKPGSRSFSIDEMSLCSPVDGKILVLPHLTETTSISVKGIDLNLGALLKSDSRAQQFYGGSAAVIRLAPYDYHRFHFFDNGQAYPAQLIRGQYHSVHPIALSIIPEIFHLNKRAVTEIHTENFGIVAYIEIGAITVASIQQTYEVGQVFRGQEKGYFQYGGSTVVLLFGQAKIVFDSDLVRDSAQNLEVRVFAGESIGRKAPF